MRRLSKLHSHMSALRIDRQAELVSWEALASRSLALYVSSHSRRSYSGAPFFSSMGALRFGADLAHVICEPTAGAVIKT